MRYLQMLAAFTAASTTGAAMAQLVNPSFELDPTGVRPTGWRVSAPPSDETNVFVGANGEDLAVFTATATDGNRLLAITAASNSFAPPARTVTLSVFQDVLINAPTLLFDYQGAPLILPPGQPVSFNVVLRNASDANPFAVSTTNVVTFNDVNSATPLVRDYSIDVSALQGSTYRLSFEFTYNAPAFPNAAFFALDNVRLVPTPGAAAPLALLGLAGLRRRRR